MDPSKGLTAHAESTNNNTLISSPPLCRTKRHGSAELARKPQLPIPEKQSELAEHWDEQKSEAVVKESAEVRAQEEVREMEAELEQHKRETRRRWHKLPRSTRIAYQQNNPKTGQRPPKTSQARRPESPRRPQNAP